MTIRAVLLTFVGLRFATFITVLQLIASGAWAQTVYVDGTKSNRGDGKSWATAYNNLSDALKSPSANVWVKQGTYKLTDNFYSNGLPIDADDTSFSLSIWSRVYGGFNGSESSLNERDYNQNKTIISGLLSGGLKSKTLATLSGTNALIDGFTFSDSTEFGLKLTGSGFLGKVENCIFENHEGIALRTYGNSHFSNCVFRNNTIAFKSTGGEIILENSFFINNPGRHANFDPGIDFYDTWVTPYQLLLIDTTYNRNPVMSTIVKTGSDTLPDETGSNIYTNLGGTNQSPYFRDASNPYGEDGILGTQDDGFRLKSNAPFIDNGKNSEVKSDVIDSSGQMVDASGLQRVYGSSVDKGLYEYIPEYDDITSNTSTNSSNIPSSISIDAEWGWMKLPWIYVNAIKSWVYYTISGSTSLVYSNKYKAWYKWDTSTETWVLVD